jgi:hypothetical protein
MTCAKNAREKQYRKYKQLQKSVENNYFGIKPF